MSENTNKGSHHRRKDNEKGVESGGEEERRRKGRGDAPLRRRVEKEPVRVSAPRALPGGMLISTASVSLQSLSPIGSLPKPVGDFHP